jgi:hypothetical protein
MNYFLLQYKDPAKARETNAIAGRVSGALQIFDFTTALIEENTRRSYDKPRFRAVGYVVDSLTIRQTTIGV